MYQTLITKGQEISEAFFLDFKSPKKQTKFQVQLSISALVSKMGQNKTIKAHLHVLINWYSMIE